MPVLVIIYSLLPGVLTVPPGDLSALVGILGLLPYRETHGFCSKDTTLVILVLERRVYIEFGGEVDIEFGGEVVVVVWGEECWNVGVGKRKSCHHYHKLNCHDWKKIFQRYLAGQYIEHEQ